MLNSVLLFFSFSGSEIMLILFVALILFGGDKFPEIARGLGKGIREFKDMSDGVKREIHSQINNYDLDINRTTTTQATNTPVIPPIETAALLEEHETHDISVAPNADVALHQTADVSAIHQDMAQHEPVTIAASTHEPTVAVAPTHDPVVATAPAHEEPVAVAEKPAMPKPDLNPPPNTISHQSY